jgi:hypothetical protein
VIGIGKLGLFSVFDSFCWYSSPSPRIFSFRSLSIFSLYRLSSIYSFSVWIILSVTMVFTFVSKVACEFWSNVWKVLVVQFDVNFWWILFIFLPREISLAVPGLVCEGFVQLDANFCKTSIFLVFIFLALAKPSAVPGLVYKISWSN